MMGLFLHFADIEEGLLEAAQLWLPDVANAIAEAQAGNLNILAQLAQTYLANHVRVSYFNHQTHLRNSNSQLEAATIERMTSEQRRQFVNRLLRIIGSNFDSAAESAAETDCSTCFRFLFIPPGMHTRFGPANSCKRWQLEYPPTSVLVSLSPYPPLPASTLHPIHLPTSSSLLSRRPRFLAYALDLVPSYLRADLRSPRRRHLRFDQRPRPCQTTTTATGGGSRSTAAASSSASSHGCIEQASTLVHRRALCSNSTSSVAGMSTATAAAGSIGMTRERKNAAARSSTSASNTAADDDFASNEDDLPHASRETTAERKQRIENEQRRRNKLRDGYHRLKDVLPVSN